MSIFPLIFNFHQHFRSHKSEFLSSLLLFKSREFANPQSSNTAPNISAFSCLSAVNVVAWASPHEMQVKTVEPGKIDRKWVGKISVRTKRARSLLLERSLPTLALPAQTHQWGLSKFSGWIPPGAPGWVTQFADSSPLLSHFKLHALQPDHKCSRTILSGVKQWSRKCHTEAAVTTSVVVSQEGRTSFSAGGESYAFCFKVLVWQYCPQILLLNLLPSYFTVKCNSKIFPKLTGILTNRFDLLK